MGLPYFVWAGWEDDTGRPLWRGLGSYTQQSLPEPSHSAHLVPSGSGWTLKLKIDCFE